MYRVAPALTALILQAVACAPGQQEPPDTQPGYAHAGCAPWDGMAVRIVLGPETDTLRVLRGPPRPGLELAAYTSLEQALGEEFRVEAAARSDDRSGGAVRCDDRGECTSASAGVIRLERLAADSTILGSYAVTFADGEVRGRFAARWLSVLRLCG